MSKVVESDVKHAIKRNFSYDDLLNELLKTFDEEELSELIARLEAADTEKPLTHEDARFAALLSKRKEPSKKERIRLEFNSLLRYFRHRKKLLEDAITPSEVAQLLGTTRQTPHDRRESGTLLAVLQNGVWRFPLWQFDPSGPNGVIDGLPEIIRTLKVSDLAKVNWLISANNVFGGERPLDSLRNGQKQRVLEEAMAVGEA